MSTIKTVQLMIPYNFHTHSKHSDGSNAPVDYVNEAIKQGFKGLGFSEHSVLPFANTFALQQGSELDYTNDIRDLQNHYKDKIDIYLAMEADYIPGKSDNFSKLKKDYKLDYIIGSVHLVKNGASDDDMWFIDGPKSEIYDQGIESVFNGDARRAVTAYWHQINRMIETETFDVIGHLDKIKMHNRGRWFNESDKWYTDLVNESIDLISHTNLIVEVNTRGIYKGRSDSLFPGNSLIKSLYEKGVRIVLSSDAHQPSELSLFFAQAIETMKDCGYKTTCIFTRRGWMEIPLGRI